MIKFNKQYGENLEKLRNVKVDVVYNDKWSSNLNLGGYRRLEECVDQGFFDNPLIKEIAQELKRTGHMAENIFEDHLLLHVVQNVKNKTLNMMELGAGYGDASITIAGLIDNTDVSSKAKDYKILGIEAEPTHAKWCGEVFQGQALNNCTALWGAVSNREGTIGFGAGDPGSSYGQSIGGSCQVPCYRVKTLMEMYNYDHLDFLHMDVQGEEGKIIVDCLSFLDKINFIFIGTHSHALHNNITHLIQTKRTHKILASLPPFSVTSFGDFGPVKCNDGMLFCERTEG